MKRERKKKRKAIFTGIQGPRHRMHYHVWTLFGTRPLFNKQIMGLQNSTIIEKMHHFSIHPLLDIVY